MTLKQSYLAVMLTTAVVCIVIGVTLWSASAGLIVAGLLIGALGFLFFADLPDDPVAK